MIEITDKGDGIFVLKVKIPEVHTLDVPDLKEKIQQTILNNEIKKVVLDLSEVKTITSSGIGIFLNINEGLKSKFRLACPSPEVKKVLELTKVTSIIKIFETVEMAIKKFLNMTDEVIDIAVIPKSSRSEIIIKDDIIKVFLNSPPEDGKANKELIKIFSKQMRIAKSDIQIIRGEKSKKKQITIKGFTKEKVFILLKSFQKV